MKHGIQLSQIGTRNLYKVWVGNGVCLYFSYSSLVAINLDNTTFISEAYINYSVTTKRHINSLPNREVISTQLFQELIDICLPEPPAQTRNWLLERSRMGLVSTPS